MEKRWGVYGAGVALVVIGLSLAPAVSVLAKAPPQPNAPTCAQANAGPGDTYDLHITFDGVIAFVPRGRQDPLTDSWEKPDGDYRDVVALIPRTDDAQTWTTAYKVGESADFYVPYERYALHHPVVRIRARHFAGELSDICRPAVDGGCGDHWVYLSLAADDPLHPQWTHDNTPAFAQYDVSVETCAAPENVRVTGFDNVPRLFTSVAPTKLAPAQPCRRCLAFATAVDKRVPDPGLAARMTLGHGEVIDAQHLIMEQGETDPVLFTVHARGRCEPVKRARQPLVACATEDEAPGAPSPFAVAQHVVAVRQHLAANVPATLTLRRMTDGTVQHSYLLRPPSDGTPLEIEVLNLPAEGLFDLPAETSQALAHFNLFYLLTDAKSGPFYFPAPRLKWHDGRPWCSNARLAAQP